MSQHLPTGYGGPPIGPGSINPILSQLHAPAQYDCTFADLIIIAETIVLPVYIAQGPTNYMIPFQEFLDFQWDNWTGVLSPNCNECCWMKTRTTHWINQYNTAQLNPGATNLGTPGSYQYNLKRAKIQYGFRVYKKCCDPGLTDTAFYALWPWA